MANRRKYPLFRSLLSILPAKIRHHLMRGQLKISKELDSRFKFRVARTQHELSEAYRILHDCYVEQGYGTQQISGMRIVKYFALPSTTTLIALFDDEVVGTISIIRRASFGLPMESVFDLSDFVDRNEIIAEVSSLAIDARFRQQRGALFLPLLKFFWEIVEGYMNLNSIVITVNPSMTDFYEGFLGFKRLKQAEATRYEFANGNPGVGLYLNVQNAPILFANLYDHKVSEKNLYRYFVDLKLPHFELPDRTFYKSSDPVMTPAMLDYFFSKKSTVLADLSVTEKLGLASVYPSELYRDVLPDFDIEKKRDHVRYQVNLKAFAPAQIHSNLVVLDVSNKGICIASSVAITGIVLLQIQVSTGKRAEVRGEVRWEDSRRKIYGISLHSGDATWAEFLSYLNQDFADLISTAQVKAS